MGATADVFVGFERADLPVTEMRGSVAARWPPPRGQVNRSSQPAKSTGQVNR